jgi:hypothetical protein
MARWANSNQYCSKWKKDVAARAKKAATEKGNKRKVVPEVFEIIDDLYMMVPGDEIDGDYEEEIAAANAPGGEFWEAMRRTTRRTRV